MSDENTITPDPTAEGDGFGAGNNPSGLKDALEATLGKQFPDEATALKAVKDTFDYVGKAGNYQKVIKTVMDSKGLSEEQAIEFIKNSATQSDKIDTSRFVNKEELEQRDFFLDNPAYKPYKEFVMTFKTANPTKSLKEITEMTEFKSVYDKAKAQDDSDQKSIVHSNPKLGQSKDKLAKAQEASKSGNQAEAEKQAVEAIFDSHEGL